MRVGVDTGGTFTDVVTDDGRILKVPSTPSDPGAAVRAGVEAAGGGTVPALLAHGTTVATNALLTIGLIIRHLRHVPFWMTTVAIVMAALVVDVGAASGRGGASGRGAASPPGCMPRADCANRPAWPTRISGFPTGCGSPSD